MQTETVDALPIWKICAGAGAFIAHLFPSDGPADKLTSAACGARLWPMSAPPMEDDQVCRNCLKTKLGKAHPWVVPTRRHQPVASLVKTHKPSGQCHHSHPPYPVAGEIVIYGGSGLTPTVPGCDVYVSLDQGRRPATPYYPWTAAADKFDLVFHIPNMGVPHDAAEFERLVVWLADQLLLGKKVHAGCMAGHGRTGMLLAALRKYLTGDENAIQHVRDNYCEKAVETPEQVAWLVKHWGVATTTARYGPTTPDWATTSKIPMSGSAPLKKML